MTGGGTPRRFAVATLVATQVAAFSAGGWLLSGVLDATGVLSLATALFLVGIAIALVACLIALEASDVPVALSMRAAQTFAMAGLADRAGLGVPLSRAQALAVVSGAISAAGLVAGAILVG